MLIELRPTVSFRIHSPISNLHGKEETLQLSSEAILSVQMHSIDSERLSVTFEHDGTQTFLQPSNLGTKEEVNGVVIERGKLALWLKTYRVFKQNAVNNFPGKDVIIKAMVNFLKQLKRTVSSS